MRRLSRMGQRVLRWGGWLWRAQRPGCLMLWHVALLHLWMAGAVLMDERLALTTPVAGMHALFGHHVMLTALGLAGASACSVSLLLGRLPHRLAVLCGMPQQILILASAWGCAQAVLAGHYADGTAHLRFFILTDQFGMILTAFTHTLALFFFHVYGRGGR